ncbi:MAG: tetratricopeptide repeat protein [Saprospiraceae bacterium]|nr:tetratricopeptide repeat protein [Saprospiraceae bacterium]
MKRAPVYLLLFLLIPVLMTGQVRNPDPTSEYIEWSGENEIANAMVRKGIGHLLNIEREKAHTYFNAAVEEDPTLFAPHVALSWLSSGEKQSYHKVQAQNLVAGKNETSRLYVSLLDAKKGKEGNAERMRIWTKMHELAHDGRLVHFYYALSLEDNEVKIAELEKLAVKNEKDESSTAHIHNKLGYTYYGEGDIEKAKMHFKKYLELYPNGYNSYDSMADFFMREGDLENAMTHYKKAKNQYPGAVNATRKIKELESMMSEEGNLILVSTERVPPEHMADYIQWGKEYKAVAQETGFREFYVSSANDAFSYAVNVGKTLGDVDRYFDEWEKWRDSHDALGEQYQKYKHSISSIERSLWRHMPNLSYTPEGYKASEQSSYVRAYQGLIKFGHEDDIKAMMKEFKKEWKEKGISQPFSVYWNEFGVDGPCIAIRSVYKDVNAWSADREEVGTKVGEDRMNELMVNWNKHMRSWKSNESFPRPDLSNVKTESVAATN